MTPDHPMPASEAAPIYRKVAYSFFPNRWFVFADTGPAAWFVCETAIEPVADWLLGVLGRQTFAPEARGAEFFRPSAATVATSMEIEPRADVLEVLDSPVRAVARRVTVGMGGRFGWWVGVLQRLDSPKWDVWHCNHQHSTVAEARACVGALIDALRGSSEPIRLRKS